MNDLLSTAKKKNKMKPAPTCGKTPSDITCDTIFRHHWWAHKLQAIELRGHLKGCLQVESWRSKQNFQGSSSVSLPVVPLISEMIALEETRCHLTHLTWDRLFCALMLWHPTWFDKTSTITFFRPISSPSSHAKLSVSPIEGLSAHSNLFTTYVLKKLFEYIKNPINNLYVLQ